MAAIKKEKEEYIKILKKSRLNEDALKKLVFLLLTGNHTIEELKEGMTKNLEELLSKYLYKDSFKIKEEENLQFLSKIFSFPLKIEFKENQTNIRVYYCLSLEK